MKPTLNVYALPKYVTLEELAGGTAVVIDVLRAATTIVYALGAGAAEILPCLEIGEAHALAEQFSPGEAILGGERVGTPIEGFELGNSPEDYTASRVGGKRVIFTTTNGTRAMTHVRPAADVLVAAFVNASATVAELLDREKIAIVCAGTDDHVSEDDLLLAGMLVDRLERRRGTVFDQNAQAITARELWLNSFSMPQAIGAESLPPDRLAAQLRKSLGARNLIALGLDDDIVAAAQIDKFDVVARLTLSTFRITSG